MNANADDGKLPCGHPNGCAVTFDDPPREGSTCGWCADRNARNALRLILDAACDVNLLMSDTFAHATADSESVHADDLTTILPLVERYGHHALTAYVAAKRGADPIRPWQTDEYRAARAEIERLAAEVKRDLPVYPNGVRPDGTPDDSRLVRRALRMPDEPTLMECAEFHADEECARLTAERDAARRQAAAEAARAARLATIAGALAEGRHPHPSLLPLWQEIMAVADASPETALREHDAALARRIVEAVRECYKAKILGRHLPPVPPDVVAACDMTSAAERAADAVAPGWRKADRRG